MLIGAAQFELLIPGAASLKEKRFVIKSIKTKIQNRFNVSIAEVDHLDKWQRACLGIAFVSNERRFLDEVMSKITNTMMDDHRFEVIDHCVEVL